MGETESYLMFNERRTKWSFSVIFSHLVIYISMHNIAKIAKNYSKLFFIPKWGWLHHRGVATLGHVIHGTSHLNRRATSLDIASSLHLVAKNVFENTIPSILSKTVSSVVTSSVVNVGLSPVNAEASANTVITKSGSFMDRRLAF